MHRILVLNSRTGQPPFQNPVSPLPPSPLTHHSSSIFPAHSQTQTPDPIYLTPSLTDNMGT